MLLNAKQQCQLDEICLRENIKNYSVYVEEFLKKGDNYMGRILSATVHENASKERRFIIKCAETNEAVRKQIPLNGIYCREIFVYDTLLPRFMDFQNKIGLKEKFESFARVYATSVEEKNEFLIMEDASDRGFKRHDRRKAMDHDHVTLVMKEIAKLHSISLAMKRLEPDTYSYLEAHMGTEYLGNLSDLNAHFKSIVRNNLPHVLKIFENNQSVIDALLKFENDLESVIEECRNERSIIVHGDLWCNNMMFAYECLKPIKVCFLDWQISKTSCPEADLFYFMFLSTSETILKNIPVYFEIYYEVLKNNMESVGLLDNDDFRTWKERYKSRCIKFAQMGFIHVLGALSHVLREDEDAVSFIDIVESGKEISETFFHDDEVSDEYCERIKCIVMVMMENEYL